MNKTEFIDVVAQNAGFSRANAKKAVAAFYKTVAETLETGDKVALLGFGSFFVVERAARSGINPKTKEKINIPARKMIRFKPGATLAKVAK